MHALPGSDVPPTVARRAVEWLVDLQGDGVTEALRQGHRAWLAEHPDHERAWRHIESVNQQLRGAARASAIAHATLAWPRAPGRRQAIKTLSVLFFAGGAAWQAERHMPWREWLADERTGIGERRTLTLADGGTVVLNTDSAISVRFTRHERRLQLIRGEVLVTTGHQGEPAGAHRPFIVDTPHGTLRPLGTRFAVRQFAQASRVAVYEGRVALRPHDWDPGGMDAGRERILRAGQQARFTRSTIGDAYSASEADTAWVDGMLVASGMRLDDFLAELSRYRPGRLACDAAIAHWRISGTYPLADTDRVLGLLRAALPVEVRSVTRWWVTVRAAGA